MPAPDTTALQVNIKSPAGTLINIYATDDADLSTKLEQVEKVVSQIAALEGAVTAASHASGMAAPVAQQRPSSHPSTGQNGPSSGPAPSGAAPTCQHGPRTYRSGVSKAGKPYKLWACTSPDRSSQCPPEWIKD